MAKIPNLEDVKKNPELLPKGFFLAQPDAKGIYKIWLSPDQFFADAWQFAKDNRNELSDMDRTVCCLARGAAALVPVVGHEAGRKDIHTIIADSYSDDATSSEKVTFHEPLPTGLGMSRDGEDLVIVDDLVDSGKTLMEAKKRWPECRVLTLYAKPESCNLVDAYHVLIPDIWVVFPWEQPWGEFEPYE